MLNIIQKDNLNKAAVLAVVVVALSFPTPYVAMAAEGSGPGNAANTLDLPARTNNEKGVSIDVRPMEFDFNKPARFQVHLDTHSGSLGFDPAEISILEDDKGNIYKPTGWDGSPPGGHHRSGVLSFPGIGTDARSIKLTLRNVRGVPERVFEWTLH